MSINRKLVNLILVCVAVVSLSFAQADEVLRESFDIPVGSLDNQAGATSFGFHPTVGTVWDSGIFGAPDVVAGSITPPVSTLGFYHVPPVGNRYSTTNGTVVGRAFDLNGPHFYGSFLTTTSLDSSIAADALYNFQNFAFRAVASGNGSFWRMDSFGFTDTGVNADGTTLVLWELEFNQIGQADIFRIWFNRNPLTEVPDFEDSTLNLGNNQLGGGGALGFHSNLYLGLSSLEIDEIRIGTDWEGVGVSATPGPVVTPGSVIVTRGTHTAGGVVELSASDNLDVTIRRASADIQSRTEFEVKGVSPVQSPTSVDVTLEGSVFARSTVNQTIELFDYAAGVWEVVDTRAATRFNDSSVTISATGDLTRFVETGTRCMEGRVRYQSLNPRQQFTSNTDQFIWEIGQ